MMKRATLELRYVGQPRLPGGATGGGQYTFGSEATAGGMPAGTRLVAAGMGRQKFPGYLVKQETTRSSNMLQCTYYDSRADYRFTVPFPGDNCPNAYLNY
jgi:hypothetical protein